MEGERNGDGGNNSATCGIYRIGLSDLNKTIFSTSGRIERENVF